MNKPVILAIVILLIIGGIALNKIINTPETENNPSPESPQPIDNPVISDSGNNTSTNNSNGPNVPVTYVQQK
ncbi:MAG: hypothetical protein PWQ15_925 [Methanobacterium sp.]|jgi:hypothetical protein|uniref:hypothetical protein n=1 Tax=Methanobacterium sp. TaxID=2164 RepID=UPI0003C9BFF0|nr:hypothetical protein [Methanobacterium sp.]MDI3549823.1 hypothetical protein [Methanobacterium sp.]CDG65291.1 putative membrane protein [Methanobacterium sp. MB1]